MKPNFALSLSFEGIRLLHRAAGGWRVVGDVALDAADMPGELSVLRRTATALEPGGLRTKLLLPSEQVKYLTFDSKDMDRAARMDAARAALDGATPYPVEDLAFDISADGDQTHVAAVARETLAEAEAFATEHRFHPTSFATVPQDNPYLGEPFFGATKASVGLLEPGEKVEPDGIAVVIIGDVAPVTPEKEGAKNIDASDEGSAEVPSQANAEETAAADESDKTLSDDVVQETPAAASETDGVEEEPEIEDKNASEDTENATITEDAPTSEDTKEEASLAQDSADTDETDAGEAPEPLSADSDADAPSDTTDDADPDLPQDASVTAAVIPAVPSLGAASRSVQPPSDASGAPAVAAPTGFASRRAPDAARREPVVTSPNLPIEIENAVAATGASGGPVPPAPPEFTTHDTNAPTPPAPRDGFLSRRKAKPANVGGAAGATPATAQVPGSEAERMTIFGARRDVGGKPRFLGLILTAALLVFLAGVAAWASVFLDDGLSLSRLFGDRAPRVEASAPKSPTPAPVPASTPTTDLETPEVQSKPQVKVASLAPALTEEDTAVLDALREPVTPEIADLSDQELEASYATTGIWPLAPVVPPEPAGLIPLEDLYITSIDPVSTANDAVALPAFASFATDAAFGKVSVPAAAGTVFALDDQGRVIPTVQGALSPDGFTVYLGRPEFIPPPTPTRFQPLPEQDSARLALAGERPKQRPSDLAETNERANLDGLTRSELAGLRPLLRPKSVQQQAEAAAAAKAEALAAAQTPTVDTDDAVETALAAPPAFESATRLAIKASVRPDTRPRNFARIVKRAQRTPQPEAETRVASTATVAPRVVTPKIPSKTSVAKQATVRNAINLRQVNLIGVYGKPSSRRALVRLANGRYKKVVVGDRIDGGRISAIGDSELRYNKRGRNVVLKMPRS